MITKKNRIHLTPYFAAVLSGLGLTFCFPDAHLWPIAFFVLVPLLVSIRDKTAKASFIIGFLTGFIHFCTLIYWIVPTLNQYGGLHPAIAAAALILLCSYLSLYPALFAVLVNRYRFHKSYSALMIAALWVGLEYIRTYAFTGFSWGALGYSQFTNLWLLQTADISGVYGISFIIVLTNAVLAQIFCLRHLNPFKSLFIPIFSCLLLLAGSHGYGFYQLNRLDTKLAAADAVTIGIVQGNIEQNQKWSPAFKTQTIDKYTRLTQTLKTAAPDLIVWPETALPFYYGLDMPLTLNVNQTIQTAQTHFLIGSPAFDRSGQTVLYFNRAYMFNPDATPQGSYDKHHLVPFGEYVPFGNLLKFLGKIIAQAGDFTAGPSDFTPLAFNDQNTGVLICFEILFPKIAAAFVNNGATYLTTLTNDAWFGYTSAARQHFSIAVFRAVENRRTLIRAANTGISGFIDPAGRILKTTGLFEDAAISMPLPAVTTQSFYTRYPDLLTWAVMVAFLILFMVKRHKNAQGEDQ